MCWNLTKKPCIESIEQADKILQSLQDNKYKITDIQVKEMKSECPAPGITSVASADCFIKAWIFTEEDNDACSEVIRRNRRQQGRRVCWAYNTYMRTDSTRISDEAVNSAREFIKKNYGDEYLPEKAKVFKGKKKNTPGCTWEAIRPTDVNRKPEDMKKIGKGSS